MAMRRCVVCHALFDAGKSRATCCCPLHTKAFKANYRRFYQQTHTRKQRREANEPGDNR